MKPYINLSINQRINYKGNLTSHWRKYGQQFNGLTPIYILAFDYLIYPNRFTSLN